MEGRRTGSLSFMGMIMVVLVQASNMVVTKMAMSDGLNKYTLAFYCNALSSLALLPCPFIISRRFVLCPSGFRGGKEQGFKVLNLFVLLCSAGQGRALLSLSPCLARSSCSLWSGE